MEATNVNTAVLSNFEVMELLKNLKHTKKKFSMRNLATITYETLQFLEDSPCKLQSMQCIGSFLQAVKPFNLLKTEILSMVNDPPTSPLQIQLIVEDSEERLTDEQVDALLETISAHLPVPQEPEDPEELLE